MLAFSFGATAVFGLLALPWMLGSDFQPGKSIQTAAEQPIASIILAMIVIGPLIEEIMFRGWLTGTMRAFLGCAAFIAIWFGGTSLAAEYIPAALRQLTYAGLALCGLALFLWLTRKKPVHQLAWFQRLFPLLFWMQGLVFGALHFSNIANASWVLSALSIAPLVICGWIWGYARVTIGFGPAWLLHTAYNIPATALIIAMEMTHRG